VELVILKNRFGTAYGKIDFKYYPQYEFFEESKEETNVIQRDKHEPRSKNDITVLMKKQNKLRNQ
jgi:hypothetical protein